MNNQTKVIHKVAGMLALFIILIFFSSSLYAEINGDHALIKAVKTFILYGIILLFIIMPVTVISGRKLSGKSISIVLDRKINRMKLIAINAIALILLAITLYYRATHNLIDHTFVTIQIIEFVFGLTNAALLTLMIRDGRLLKEGKF
jgi:hypothetical protein